MNHPYIEGRNAIIGLIKYCNLISDKHSYMHIETVWLSNECQMCVSSQIFNRGWPPVKISAQKFHAARVWRPNRNNPIAPKQEPFLHIVQKQRSLSDVRPLNKSQDPNHLNWLLIKERFACFRALIDSRQKAICVISLTTWESGVSNKCRKQNFYAGRQNMPIWFPRELL